MQGAVTGLKMEELCEKAGLEKQSGLSQHGIGTSVLQMQGPEPDQQTNELASGFSSRISNYIMSHPNAGPR